MGRDFVVNGETLVRVKGGSHTGSYLSGGISVNTDLGLAVDSIRVIPKFVRKDIYVDDFGPDIPAEVLFMLGECTIQMGLVHYDPVILNTCVAEGMAGGGGGNLDGVMAPAGTPMGALIPVFSSGCHYVSLNLLSPQLNLPWRFRACYLNDPPFNLPLGTEKSIPMLNWRAIPYTAPQTASLSTSPGAGPSPPGELISSGIQLWDRVLNT